MAKEANGDLGKYETCKTCQTETHLFGELFPHCAAHKGLREAAIWVSSAGLQG